MVLQQDGSVDWQASHPDGVGSLVSPVVGPDGSIYAGDFFGLQLWSVTSGGTTRWVGENTSGVLESLGVSPDNGTLVVTGGPMIRGVDPGNGNPLWQIGLEPEQGLPQFAFTIRPGFSPSGDTAYLTTRFVGDGVGHSYLYAIDLTATPGVVPGDLDGDGVVGIQDFLALLAAWGPCPAPPTSCAADLDGDGTVGITDFLILLANWR